jgi:N-hydroxyarylamine O-acetyltransferase
MIDRLRHGASRKTVDDSLPAIADAGLAMIDRTVMRFDDYLRRIGQPRPTGATVDTLRRLHVAHREAFLFENLSIQAGGGISLALGDLERKFLDQNSGGYCFEHNTLFAAALREAGFTSTALLGRVRRGPPKRWARTHMVLRLPIGDEVWLADVGFGGLGLLEPIPLREDVGSEQGGFTYRLRRDGYVWVLSMRDADGADVDLYEFSEEPQTRGDIEVANHFTSTHPESIFRKTLTIQRTAREERTILRSDAMTRYRRGRISEEHIARERLRDVVRDEFAIQLPDGPLVFDG